MARWAGVTTRPVGVPSSLTTDRSPSMLHTRSCAGDRRSVAAGWDKATVDTPMVKGHARLSAAWRTFSPPKPVTVKAVSH